MYCMYVYLYVYMCSEYMYSVYINLRLRRCRYPSYMQN